MDANKREHFRKLLEKRLHELDHTLDIMKENNTSEQDKYSPSELSNYDTILLSWERSFFLYR